ncbi:MULTISPECIES: hypothetical protein [unclassified Mucilaginibacter]|uniref:hypothetical protein n=1 Tax=unclassified Mucilaginibacter TaxID=2617802 RepID=UPI002AC97369|nr:MULTISPECIES: hypothetical protein [unclassified Mucilaginibacter]MEB0261427.1 hypothetical protein [Mucilaginibacter sp. 10I4]MEB0276987.1 hypothetical protein [Mucilaginibacter sp. 10B2]MEB0301490.1 hypothetical protein [Mucilaginibacter sp. 5C4]WPX25087.1 hypothetical protein RHM67_07390 [Mucilaginibacter sp. 5C4]
MKYFKVLAIAVLAMFAVEGAKAQVVVKARVGAPVVRHTRTVAVNRPVHRAYYRRPVVVRHAYVRPAYRRTVVVNRPHYYRAHTRHVVVRHQIIK